MTHCYKQILIVNPIKYNYSGNIKFHNQFHAGLLELNYQQGELMCKSSKKQNKQKIHPKNQMDVQIKLGNYLL
jgi:hypothetical protein